MLRTLFPARRRPCARLILLIMMAGPVIVSAQDLPQALRLRRTPAPPAEEDTREISDLRLQRVYESALTTLERGDLVNGLPLLQSILDHPRDTLYYPDPQDRDQAVSLKGLVLEALNALPEDQLEQYNVLYDPAAREILDLSQQRSAQATLEDVVRRFYFTDTGREAALRLAKMYFDRGNFLASALTFQRLLDERRVPARERPIVLMQTAVALRLTGLDDKCRETLLQLKEESQDGTLKIGGRTLSLEHDADETLVWLDKVIVPGVISARQDPQTDWSMFRGNSERNATSSGGPPLREQNWVFRTLPLVESDDPRELELVEQKLQALSERFASTRYLQLPAMHPLIVGDRIVFRSLGNIKAINLRTGEYLWETFTSNQKFEDLLKNSDDSFVTRDDQISELEEYIMLHTWRDVSAGTLSSDGTYVYAIEELGVDNSNQFRYPNQPDNNQLFAYELSSGKATMVLGDSNKYQARFLGPPLVQGDILYCLAERNEEIFLLALKGREIPGGSPIIEILWEQPLPLPVNSEIDTQLPQWRVSGLTPSYANGMLICPIAHGTVVAYDLARGILAWQYRYPGEQFPSRRTMANLNRYRERYGLSREDENRWLDSVPTIARSRILLTPCDSPELHCLNLSTGIPFWTVPRGEDLYIASVRGDQIVLVGREQIHARHLETGAELWSVPIAMPSGRGFVTRSEYYVPLSTAAIAVIDLEHGKLRAVIPSQHNRVPGNLVAANGFVVSQTENHIFRYLTEDELKEQLDAEGDTVDSGILRGELALLEGRTAESVTQFVNAYQTFQSPRLRDLLVQTLIDALQEDFEGYRQYVPQLKELTRGTAEYPAFQETLAAGLTRSGATVEAFSQFLSLLDQPSSRLDRRTVRIRSDVWARGQVRELYEQAEPAARESIDKVVQAKVEQLLQQGSLKTLTRAESILQEFPGSIDLQRARLAQLDEYTDSLALELLLIRLSQTKDDALRREAVGRHFQLLMKLERVEQAARVREILLEQYPDQVCVDEMTGSQLAEWGLENRQLQEYLTRRTHTWPLKDAVVTPTRERPMRPSADLYHVPIVGDPGLFTGWSFHLTNQKPPRLLVLDEFGEERAQILLDTSQQEPANLSLNRAIHLRGHLAVLVLADQFYVFDLFQDGTRSFLHGPHPLNERMAGLEIRDLRESVIADMVPGPNGHPQHVIRDFMNERLGQIAAVTTDKIVFQRDRELVAIESLTGEELWSRRIGEKGQLLASDGQLVACRPMGQRTVTLFRTVDGEPLGQFELPERHYVFAVHGRLLIVLERLPSENGDQQPAESDGRDENWQLSAYDLREQKAIWSLPASSSTLVQSADEAHLAVVDGKSREFQFIRVADGQVLARQNIATTVPPQPVQEPQKTEPGQEPAEAAVPKVVPNASDILAFWISPSLGGYLLTTVDQLGNGDEVRVSSLGPDRLDEPVVHGEVLQLNPQGEKVWQRRVENQVYDPVQPLASPVICFMARHIPNQRRFITTTNQVAVEILNRQTGEQLFEQVEVERHSQLHTVVDPEQQWVKLLGTWNSYVINFGQEEPPNAPAPQEKSP